MFHVMAGNFTASPNNIRQIGAIYTHDAYNATTFQNNIAVVKLATPFLLRNNTQMKWLKLDDGRNHHENCWASFLIPQAQGYPFSTPQQSNVLDNWFCNGTAIGANPLETICAHYSFADSSMCTKQSDDLLSNEDRGTPLVCNNVLSGVLSVIIPPSNSSGNATATCFITRKTFATYTKLSQFERWVNEIIFNNQPSVVGPVYTSKGRIISKNLKIEINAFSFIQIQVQCIQLLILQW